MNTQKKTRLVNAKDGGHGGDWWRWWGSWRRLVAVVGHRAGFLFPLYLHRGTNKKPALPLCGSPLPYYVQCWAAILLAEGMLSLHNGREINNAPPPWAHSVPAGSPSPCGLYLRRCTENRKEWGEYHSGEYPPLAARGGYLLFGQRARRLLL